MQDRLKIYIRERKDRPGKWLVDIRGGSRGRCTQNFASETEARAYAAEVTYVAQAKGVITGERTVGAMIEGYLRSLTGRGLAESTMKHRREMLVAVRSILVADSAVKNIATEDDIRRFATVRQRQVGRATFRHNMWALKQALMWAQGQGWIVDIPEIELPKMPPPRQVWLRSHEVAPFLEACSDTFRPIAEAAIYFGLREGELCVSQASDFDLSAGILWVAEKPELDWKPKGGRARGIPLQGRGREIAKTVSRRPASSWAWPNRGSGMRKPGTWFSRATKRAAAAMGIERNLVFHDLRRTFGAMMIEGGAHIRAVQHALGHASVVTTEKVYAPITQEFVAEGMKKMDEMLATKAEAHRASQPQPPLRLRVIK